VDERRVPSQGLKMRCPKCGESFQVVAPSASDPPVLGAALALHASDAARPPPLKRRTTTLGMPSSPPPAAAPKGSPPVPKRTMRGVAPGTPDGFELAQLDDDESLEADEDELDLSVASDDDSLDLPATVEPDDLLMDDLPERVSSPASEGLDLPTTGGSEDPDEFDLPALNSSEDLPSPIEAGLPDLNAGLPDLGAELPDLGGNLPSTGAALPQTMGDLPDLTSFGDDFDDLGVPDSLESPMTLDSERSS